MGIRARLLDPKNVKELADILTYHVAAGSVHAKDLKNGESIKTVEGKDVRVHLLGKRVFINRSQVTKADIDASNGVIHIIDELLIPTHTRTHKPTHTTASTSPVFLDSA